MKCLNCGAYVYTSDKFCRSCGTTLTSDNCQYGDNITNSKYDASSCHTKQYDYSNEYSNKNKDSDTSYTKTYDYADKYQIDYSKYAYAMPNDSGGEDKYVKAYIGPNYNSIKKMKFSFPGLIFGPFYLLYRKAWGYAIAIFIISIAATALLSDSTAEIINLLMNIFIACKFKEIYIKQAEEKTEHIQQQNLDKTTKELLDICKKKGGITKLPILLVILIPVIIVIAAIILVASIEYETSLPENNDVIEMSYVLPYGFTTVYENNAYKSYKYTTPTGSSCNIIVDTLHTNNSLYYDETSYLNYTYRTTQSPIDSQVQNITLNNRNWKMRRLEGNRIETGYATVEEDKLFIVKTHHYKANGQDIPECALKYNEFLNSVTIN